jgi:hypothetical protein
MQWLKQDSLTSIVSTSGDSIGAAVGTAHARALVDWLAVCGSGVARARDL